MKKIIIFLGLLIFIPKLSAATYYDWEQVPVDTLPEATKDIMNKVYIKEDKYYVVNEKSGGVTPIPLSTNLNNYTLYKAFPDDITDIPEYQALLKYTDEYTSYFDLKGIFLINFNLSSNSFNLHFYCKTSTNCYTYTLGNNFNFKYSYDYISPNQLEVTRFSSSRSFPEEFKDFILYLYNHISITSLENTYEWLEVDKSNVLPVIQNKIYVPSSNLSCYRFIDRNTLRGYFVKPNVGDEVDFYDFYLDQHYNSITGSETLNEDISCLTNITTNYLYRNDIVEVLIFFMIVGFFVFYIPIKILFRLFRRFN